MKNRSLHSLFASVIVFQIGFGFPMLSYGATSATNSKLTAENIVRPLIAKLMLDPVFAAFANAPKMPKPEIDVKDPAVDRDPLFLRSQEWTSIGGSADAREVSFTKERDSSLSLHVPGARKTLHINQALSPVLYTDEYIFMTADQNSQLFVNASGKLEKNQTVGEGVFFINTVEWLKAAQVAAPVKVHFFPLPGHGWTGQIEADFFADHESISISSNEGDWLPVEMEDVRQIEKVQSLNALLGAVVAARSGSATPGGVSQLMPARGSTYGFGMLFTGFDLDNPANSIAGKTRSMLKPLWATILNLFSIKEANAALEVSAELVDKLIRFGWTFGAIAAVSVAMKYTILKDKFKERYALKDLRMIPMLEFDAENAKKIYRNGISTRRDLITQTAERIADITGLTVVDAEKLRVEAEASYNAPPTVAEVVVPEGKIAKLAYQVGVRIDAAKKVIGNGVTKIVPESVRKGSAVVLKEVIENGDVFAHSLTTVSQLRPVLTGNVIERLTDRYMPATAAGGNRLMRKVLNYVFYWGRSVASGTPVSLKTFMLGGVVMGTIDTYFVYVQQVAFIPWAAQALAPYLPSSLEERIVKTFEPNNEQTRTLIVNDVIRNYVGWMTAGASGYSQDTQQQFEPQVRKQVDDELKRAGKNPLDPEVKEERERKYNDAMNLKLKRQGLPDQADFLFDPNTVDAYVLQKLGIRLSDEAREKSGESSFIAETRPGLIMSALLQAIKIEKRALKASSSPARLKALEILEDTRKKLSAASLWTDNIQAMRAPLTMLTMLTYSGKVDTLVRHVPELWSNVDPEGAQEAALRFRQAFFAFYKGDGTLIELPPSFVNSRIDEAKTAARLALSNKYGLKPIAEGLTDVTDNRKAEFALLVEENIRQAYADRNALLAANNVPDPDKNLYQRIQDRKAYKEATHTMSWYEKIQHQRSYRKTMERVAGETENVSQATLNKYYSEAMAAEVSLYPVAETPEEKTVLEFILLKAATDTLSEMSHDPLKTHISKLLPAEQAQMEMRIFAMNYLESYRSATVDQGLVPPRSPMQPGFTQKFRQNHRDSKLLTVLARIVDSGFSDEVGYKMGLKAKLYRNIPTLFDMTSSTVRLGKSIITGSTLGWAYQKLVWGVNIPFASFLLFFLVSPLISAPSQWLNRAFRQQGLQPMGGVISKTLYGIPYAWVTFGATIPWVLYSADAMVAVKAMGTAITTLPIMQTLGSFGDMALPWLPALAVIPIITEIRERRANRKAIRESASKLEVRDNVTSLSGIANPKLSGSETRACETLFAPAK